MLNVALKWIGLRGRMEAGFARMNAVTVIEASQVTGSGYG